MQTGLFDHFLLLAAVLCAVTLVKLLRRSEGIGRGYALVVGGQLIFSVLAMGASRFWGAVAIGLVAVTVALPWLFEQLSRLCFARGRLVWVARLSSLRASLMPGSGLAAQLPIIEGLALLESKGVDAALAHFRRLADETEDSGELAMIHEQIVAMLFYGQRWDEGIAHYERRFQPGYAALRPSLALGLLRAYGESGRLDNAAGLLRAMEEGPVGADPNTAELLGQARLTFLAYAGAVEPVDEVVERRRFADLGLSAATAELFKGIAQARAGEPKQAAETLSKVEELAGPADRRVREAARSVLDGVREALAPAPEPVAEGPAEPSTEADREAEIGVELEPELRSYVEVVADRLRDFVLAAPIVRRFERPLVTYLLMVGLSLAYGMHLIAGGGGMGLLELGALSEDLWRVGGLRAWARPFTAAWIHVDLVGLLFDVYAIWLSGQVVERTLGPARMAWVTLVPAILGMLASLVALPLLWGLGIDSLAVVGPAGGSLMAVGAIVAALWVLLPSRTPTVVPRVRRNLVVTLSLLLVANLLISWPSAVGVAPVALLVAVTVASAVVLLLPLEQPRWLGRLLGVGAALVLLANLGALGLVVAEDPEGHLVGHRAKRCELGGVVVHVPINYEGGAEEYAGIFEVPAVAGLIDGLELRDGSLVQLAVHRGELAKPEPESNTDGDSLLALFAALDEPPADLSVTAAGPLPEPFAAALADDPEVWRARDLWRNGERVARVIERRLPAPEGEPDAEPATLFLLAAPPKAVEHSPELWAAIMREASVDPDARERLRCAVD